MSDLTLFLHGKISPDEFTARAAAEIRKDLGIFGQGPFLDWALTILTKLLVRAGISQLVAELIVHEIEALIKTPPPAQGGSVTGASTLASSGASAGAAAVLTPSTPPQKD